MSRDSGIFVAAPATTLTAELGYPDRAEVAFHPVINGPEVQNSLYLAAHIR